MVCPAGVRSTGCGQPRSEHVALEVLRNTIFQARFPIPRSGSPAMASGTLMSRSAARHGAGTGRARGPATGSGRAEAGPAVRSMTAAAAVIARRTADVLSVLRAMVTVRFPIRGMEHCNDYSGADV